MARRRKVHCCDHGDSGALDGALDKLRERGFRITEQRKALLTVLTSEHGPFTALELHSKVESLGCDPVTVYRCLATLEEADLVRRCDFGDGTYRYEFNTGEHHHHHVICRVCSSVKTIEGCFAGRLERLVKEMGYSNVSHTLEIFGTCQRCANKNATKAN